MAFNRLSTPVAASSSAVLEAPAPRLWQAADVDSDSRQDCGFASFTPTGYESGYAYPLIVWLHGDGSSERELPEVMRHVSLRNFLAVAPRAGERPDGDLRWRQDAEGIDAAESAAATAIESAVDWFNVHEQRVFVAGVGAGGAMALRLALRRPEWFAGAMSIDGPLPRGERLLSRVNEARGLPLLLSAARQSAAYPEQRVCEDLRLLHAAGCCVSVRQYPGTEPLTTVMLADVNRWVMEMICG